MVMARQGLERLSRNRCRSCAADNPLGNEYMKRIQLLLVGILLVSQGALVNAADLVLVQQGEPKAEIVIAEQPTRLVQIAAEDLRNYIEKMSGAKLSIVTQLSGKGVLPVFVGRSSHTDTLKITDE